MNAPLMERITVTLESHVAAKLRREARRRHISVSALVRERLHEAEGDQPRRKVPWAGVGESGKPDLAAKMDDELAKSWAADLKQGTV